MKKILYISLILISLVANSCKDRTITDQTKSFDNGTWCFFEPVCFDVEVTDIDPRYCVSVTMRYDTTLLLGDELPLVVDFYSDSNELHNFFPTLRLRTKEGKRRGSTIGQYCTVTDTIDRIRSYNRPAVWTYRIKQCTSKYEIHGISSLNLRIERLRD